MPEDKEFPTGLFVSPPRPTAPGFVKGRISIRVGEFLEYLSTKDSDSWLRIDVKEGFKKTDEGHPTWYGQVDTWKPKAQQQPKAQPQEETGDEPLPF